jgi:2-keto-4-pentenoate hydratase
MTTATSVAEAGHRLDDARRSGIPCRPVRDLLPAGDIDAAYAVQLDQIERRVAAGGRVVGRKIGLTSPAVQAQLGVDRPDFGFLLEDMACPAGEPIDAGRLLQPRIEAEIAFVLGADLDAADVGEADVAAATATVVAALEIVDSRIAGWDISILDTVADNASSGLFVLGLDHRPLRTVDLVGAVMTLHRGDEVVSTGSGAACLGNPLAAVAWLARAAHRHGRPLRAGEVVLSGALGPMVAVAAGDDFHATIGGLGEVRASFAGDAA